MEFLQLLSASPGVAMVLAAVFGLIIGSFLNVVIARLPVMMQREWEAQCREWIAGDAAGNGQDRISGSDPAAGNAPAATLDVGVPSPDAEPARFNLSHPPSHCPACKHPIAWYRNIPVVSWLLLRGKCHACGTAISWRYPTVELLTAALFGACVAFLGVTGAALAGMAFCAACVALAFIDADTSFLPDDITLPLLWGGLLVNLFGFFVPVSDAVIGAMAGYLALWLVYWAFKLLTGKEGMGYGDFKLLAAIGAWMGWQALPVVMLASSIAGVIIGGGMILSGRAARGQALPFGPYLAVAGVTVLLSNGAWRGLMGW
ncbi:type 4 prepilin-like proteins leader peptide-processing enzyme [Pigmentiphaga litoralis]|uniref:prepilin peptidase n=1 Tax=Pigmentiphaga litoralis TaxID=516702 RepID=UPI001679ED4B|nr:A24 family peptidase [Pigmentiphaga litoralis]GGX16740.1 type 4 prepilin-like proteins leader peptide-processing enzyme [Pigmentiphaga litoralis]